MTRAAEVVAYSIGSARGEVVVGVAVTCPNGCRDRRRPATHHHGWTRTRGEDGGYRAAHCGADGARGYRLTWPGGPPVDVVAALTNRTETS